MSNATPGGDDQRSTTESSPPANPTHWTDVAAERDHVRIRSFLDKKSDRVAQAGEGHITLSVIDSGGHESKFARWQSGGSKNSTAATRRADMRQWFTDEIHTLAKAVETLAPKVRGRAWLSGGKPVGSCTFTVKPSQDHLEDRSQGQYDPDSPSADGDVSGPSEPKATPVQDDTSIANNALQATVAEQEAKIRTLLDRRARDSHRIRALDSSLIQERSDRRAVERHIATIREDLNYARSEVNSERRERTRIDEKRRDLLVDCRDLRRGNEAYKDKVKSLQTRLSSLEAKLRQRDEAIEELETDRDALDNVAAEALCLLAKERGYDLDDDDLDDE